MAPPSFSDLGKDARDLFSKGFHNGIVKLDLKTVSENKVEFKVTGSHALQGSNATDAKLEWKSKGWPCKGVTLTESVDVKNALNVKFEAEDKLAKGLKLTLDSNFNLANGSKDVSLKTNYKHENANLNLDSGLALGPPIVNASGVFGYRGWLGGFSVGVDTGKQSITKQQLAVGYYQGDLKAHTYVKDLSEFGGAVYHKVNADTELGVTASWSGSGSGAANTKFALAAKRKLDGNSSTSISVDNKSIVNLGYSNTIQPGVKLTLSSLVDAKAFSGGDHKFGLGLDFEL